MIGEEVCELDGMLNEGDEFPTTTSAGVISAFGGLACEVSVG